MLTVSATSQLTTSKKDGPKSSALETKSQQASLINPDASAHEIEVQFKDEIHEFASLSQLSSHSSHDVLFANQRAVGQTRYQLPESSVSYQGKVLKFVDTYN